MRDLFHDHGLERGRAGTVLTAAFGLLILGAFLMESPSVQRSDASLGELKEGTQKATVPGEFVVPEAIMARFADSMSGLVWPVAEPLHVMVSESEVAGAGENQFFEEREAVEWPLRRVRPIYEIWEDGAELIWVRSSDARRFQYKIDPTFGVGNGLPRIQGMMIRFRVDF
jgi:hypothetical protein